MVPDKRSAGKQAPDAEPGSFTSSTARGWMVFGLRQQITETTNYLLRLREQLAALESGRVDVDIKELPIQAGTLQLRKTGTTSELVLSTGNGASEPGTLTTGDAASYLGMTRSAIQQAAKKGTLHISNPGPYSNARPMRFLVSALDAYNAQRSAAGYWTGSAKPGKKTPDVPRDVDTITTKEAASLLNVSVAAITDAARRGRLPRTEQGTYLRSDVLAYRDSPQRRKLSSTARAAMRANAANMRARKASKHAKGA